MGISARASVSPVVIVNGLVRVTGVSRKKLFFSVGFSVGFFLVFFYPTRFPPRAFLVRLRAVFVSRWQRRLRGLCRVEKSGEKRACFVLVLFFVCRFLAGDRGWGGPGCGTLVGGGF